MRIAVAAEGTRGDVHPTLDLASGLVAHGHEAVVLAPPDFREECARRALEFRPVGLEVRSFLAEQASALTDGGLRFARAGRSWVAAAAERQFEALPDATRDVDLLVGAGVQIAGPSVAEKHGIPYRYLVYCPAILRSSEYPPVVLPVTRLPRGLNRLAWLLNERIMGATVRAPLNRCRASMGLAPVGDVYAHLMTERPLVAAEPALAPVPSDCPYAATHIGCLHVPRHEPLPPKIESFLALGPPPVFVGFGSMTDPDPDATTRMLLETVERLGCRAMIQEGWARLGNGPLPDHVVQVGTCAHASLFPRCAAVVHHGGAGTTTAAARAGVPQVVVAHVADQFYWGRRVHELGLGPPPLRRSRLDSRRLTEALSATLSNEIVAQRAAEMAERLRTPHPLDADPMRFL